MIASRLLLVLAPSMDASAAEGTIRRAYMASARPLALRFAAPLSLASALSELPEEYFLLFYDDALGLSALPEQLTDETHFLLLSSPYAFSQRWDVQLLRTLRGLGAHSLLTGQMRPCPPKEEKADSVMDAPTQRLPNLGRNLAALRQSLPELKKAKGSTEAKINHPSVRFSSKTEPAVSEAYLPALKESVSENSVAIGRGLALVCAEGPIKTLVIDPDLLMGPISFLRECDLTPSTLSLAAYVAGYAVYALHEPWLWPIREPDKRFLIRPSADVLPGSTMARFEQLLGFHYGQPHTTGKAAMGLFIPEDTYPQRMPGNLMLEQKLRLARLKLKEAHLPLMVSAYTDLPSARNSPAFYTLRFGFLRRIASLPLLLFTGGSQERALRASFPNTLNYPTHGLLPNELLAEGMTPAQHFARSKPLLMLRAAKKRVEFSHAAWVDMDILPHPVCAEAAPNLSSLMDDRIHLATVEGIPDLSFLVIPAERLGMIARETLSLTQLDAELKRDFSEEILWQRLFHKKPEWFAIHPMPRRRLLFLSLFDPGLLSVSVRSHLSDLPPVYRPDVPSPTRSSIAKEL